MASSQIGVVASQIGADGQPQWAPLGIRPSALYTLSKLEVVLMGLDAFCLTKARTLLALVC